MGRKKVDDEIAEYEQKYSPKILSNLLTTSNVCTSYLSNSILPEVEKSVVGGGPINLEDLKRSVNLAELRESDDDKWDWWFQCGSSLDLSEASMSIDDVVICLLGLKIHKLSTVSIVARTYFTDIRTKQYQLYCLLLEAQKAAMNCLKPGNSLSEAHNAATSIIRDQGGVEVARQFVLGFGADKLDASRVLVLGMSEGSVRLNVERKVSVSLGLRDLENGDSKYSILVSDMIFVREKQTKGRIVQELDAVDVTMASSKIFPLILSIDQVMESLPTLHELPSKLKELVLARLGWLPTLNRKLIRMLADYFSHCEAPLGVVLRIMHDIIRLYCLKRLTDEEMVRLLVDPLLRSCVESGSIERKLGLVHISDQVAYSISCLDHPSLFKLLQDSLLRRWSEATSIYNKLGLIRVIDELLMKLKESKVKVSVDALVNIISNYLADSFKALEDSDFKDCPSLYECLLVPIYSILILDDDILNGVARAINSDTSTMALSFVKSCRKFKQIRFIEHEKHMHKKINLALKVKEILLELFPERQFFSSSARQQNFHRT